MRHPTLEPIPTPSYDVVVPKFETLLSSEYKGWHNLQVYTYKLEPQPEPVVAPIIDGHIIPVLLQGRGELSSFIEGRTVRAQVCPGITGLVPQRMSAAYSWTDTYVVAHLYLSSVLTLLAAEDLSRKDPERIELVPQPFFRDPLIEQIGLALVDELESEGLLGNLYADTLGQALALHVLRHYSSLTTTKEVPGRGLSQRQLHLVCDYIGDHLPSEISLDDLAGLTGMSAAAFAKQFKRSTGLPPHQYLIQRRVERAKELLSSGNLGVAEVSQSVGFFDQSHLVRHFKSWVGVTPKAYRDSHLRS